MKRSLFITRWLGPLRFWIGASNYEHPARWAGIWIPKLGEFEIHVTSSRVHRVEYLRGKR